MYFSQLDKRNNFFTHKYIKFHHKIGETNLAYSELLIGIQLVNIDRSSLQEGSRPSRCYEKYLQDQAITDNSSGCRRCGGLYCAETKDVCTFKVLPKVNLLRSFLQR